jgi:hypothetical protein
MLRVLVAAGLALTSSMAVALTKSETDAALATISTSTKVNEECLAIGNGKLDRKLEFKDLNGDGIDEIIVKDTGTAGPSMCFGEIGQQVAVLISDGKGEWRSTLDFPAENIRFEKRDGSPWPDAHIDLGRECQPVWRMSDSGLYQILKKCDGGRLVNVSPATKEPSTIGTQVPTEILSGKLDGPPYDHNGSIVIIDADKGVIAYDRPKKSIASSIKPGTVLFRGQPWKEGDPDIVVKGTAYTFKKGCPAAAYEVRGTYHTTFGISKLTLEGAAPVRSKTSCDIVGHTTVGANTKLVFDIAIE